MPRKKALTSDTSQKIFPTRLRELMEKGKISQPQLAAAVGVQRQTISNYACGQSSPDWETLVRIAEFFDVSSDYLIGLSSVKTEDHDVRFVCDYTGLNEKTIDKFHKYAHLRNHESRILEVFDCLINVFYEQIIIKLFLIKNSVERGKQYLSLTEPEPGQSSVIFGPLRMRLYSFSEFCRRIPNELFGSDEVFDNLEKQSWIYITEKEIGLDEFLENSEEDLN